MGVGIWISIFGMSISFPEERSVLSTEDTEDSEFE